MENLKHVFLLVAACQAFLLSLSLFFSSRRDRSNPFLGVILFVIAVELLNAWAVDIHYHSSANPIPFWILCSYLLLPPSVWFMQQTYSSSQLSKKWIVILYLPGIVEIVVESASYVTYKLTGKSFQLGQFTAWFIFTELIPILWMVVSLLMFWWRVYQSFKGKQQSKYPTKLVVQLSIISALTVLWFLQSAIQIDLYSYIELFLITSISLVAYLGYFKPDLFERSKENVSKNLLATLPEEQLQDMINRLHQKLRGEKIFLQPRLTLEQLSYELKLQPRHTSAVIQHHFKQSFTQLINTYRVKEVLQRINDPAEKNKTLLAIALECGFNSKSSFNQIFKEHTGKTPSSYLKK
jgi:AraC-like DNA-binding protein